jgi:hypothetical protein
MPRRLNLRGRAPIPKRHWWRGLVLPGYNHLGPFNSKDNGPPTNPSDKAASTHDDEYTTWRHYISANKADDDFIERTNDATDYGGYIGNKIFKAKRELANRGILGRIDGKKQKLSHPTIGAKRKATILEPNRIVKRSLFNTPDTVNMSTPADGGGSGNNTNATLKETPVDDVYQVHRGPPNYTFASLPYLQNQTWHINRYAANEVFRMTSPYDCRATTTLVDLNTNVTGAMQTDQEEIDSVDPNIEKARWFEMYASMYRYYHVVSCRWHATFENLTTEPLWVHQMYHGPTVPPAGASNTDMMLWSDCKSHYVGPVGIAVSSTGHVERNDILNNTDNAETATTTGTTANFESGNMLNANGPSNILIMSGEYKPGDADRDIKTDELVENWTAVSTNPKLTERLLLRIRPQWDAQKLNDILSFERSLKYRLTIKLEYLTEFKELKEGLKWPIQQQPISITINNTSDVK